MIHTKIADKICPQSVWSPFSICHISILVDHKAELLGPSAELFQASLCFIDCLDPFQDMAIPATEGITEGFEPWVELDDA